MRTRYLEALDGRLAAGLGGFSADFIRRHVLYVWSRQEPDGGFAGRSGGSDVYYTDFALRVVALAAPEAGLLAAAAAYVRGLAHEPRDLVECFNRLNCARILGRHRIDAPVDRAAVERHVSAAPSGAYAAFLAELCCQMAGLELPARAAAVAAVSALRCREGGFRERTGDHAPTTNATAAAAAFLTMNGALAHDDARAAAELVGSMQSDDGGFRSHGAAPEADLLSTFTALVTLAALGALNGVNLPAAGRFVRALAADSGGFRASPTDRDADVEYTYYGLASAALLRWHVQTRGAAQGGSPAAR